MVTLWLVRIAIAITESAAQVQMRPEKPTELWPVSISGWVTLISSLIALIAVIWRANNKPVLDRLDAIEQKFAGEVLRIEQRIEDIEEHREKDEASFLRQVDDRINGFGRRVDEVREDVDTLENVQGTQALAMMEYKSDQKSMDRRLTELRTVADTLVSQLPQVELRMNNSLHDQTKDIMTEITKLLKPSK